MQKTFTFDYGVFRPGDVVAIEYLVSNHTFYVFRNGTEITDMRWPDTTGVVTHGSTGRTVCVLTNSANSIQYPGPAIDDMSGYDIQVAA